MKRRAHVAFTLLLLGPGVATPMSRSPLHGSERSAYMAEVRLARSLLLVSQEVTMARILSVCFALLTFAACDEVEDTGAVSGACLLAAENDVCPECYSGDATCTFEETTVTEGSCGVCQAESALYQELCDAGETATRGEIVAGLVCEEGTL
jgi:hypothetical protein